MMDPTKNIDPGIFSGEFRVMLYPKGFDEARQFYARRLRLPILKEWDHGKGDRGVMFQAGPAVIELLAPEKANGPVTGCGLSIEVPSVWSLWETLKNETSIVFGIRDNPWGDTSFRIADPEGFEITFFTKRPSCDP